MVLNHGDTYIVTGTFYGDENIKQIKGKVLVPDHIFKAIYNPSLNTAGVYFSKNSDNDDYAILSLREFETITGINPFPSLSDKLKKTQPKLPSLRDKK